MRIRQKEKWMKVGLLAMCFATLLPISSVANAEDIDIYFVYASHDKEAQRSLKNAFASEYNVKSYNIDLLAIADYTGRQKAMAKLSQAKVVVLVKDKPRQILAGQNSFSTVEVSDASSASLAKIRYKISH